MASPQSDYPASDYSYPFDRPTALFVRSGVPGLFPDQRAPQAELADEPMPESHYGRRINDIGQELRRCVEFG